MFYMLLIENFSSKKKNGQQAIRTRVFQIEATSVEHHTTGPRIYMLTFKLYTQLIYFYCLFISKIFYLNTQLLFFNLL